LTLRWVVRTPAIPVLKGAILELKRRFEPPLHVEEDPPQVGVVSDRFQNERVIKRVKERPEIQVDRPVVSPTPLPACPQRVMSRPSRPVPIGVRVEDWLHLGLQVQTRDRLSDPVSDCGHAIRESAAGLYDDDALEAWACGGSEEELRRKITTTAAFVAVVGGQIVGWATLEGTEVEQL